MSFRDPILGAVTALIEGLQTGVHTLPAELVEAWETLRRLEEVEHPAGPSSAAVATELVDGFVAAAHSGGEWPDLSALGEARRREQEVEDRRQVLAEAAEQAGRELVALAGRLASAVLVEHLRPALADLVERARKAAAAFVQYGTDSASLLNAPQKARENYLLFGGLVTRYAQLRGAQDRVVDLLPKPQHDVTHVFAEIMNTPDLWPEYRSQRNPPWPEDPQLRLLWLVNHNDAVLWMPTPAEQDKRWLAYYGQQLQERSARHQAVSAAAGLPG